VLRAGGGGPRGPGDGSGPGGGITPPGGLGESLRLIISADGTTTSHVEHERTLTTLTNGQIAQLNAQPLVQFIAAGVQVLMQTQE